MSLRSIKATTLLMQKDPVMQLLNTENSYGIVTIFLHWLMAILLIGLLALGLYMVTLPISHQKIKFYRWHKEYGFLAFRLVFFRLLWRITNITPRLSLPLLEKFAARSVHWAFYI